jgi:hypothetical protein
VSGLQPGERVILNPPDSLVDGVEVVATDKPADKPAEKPAEAAKPADTAGDKPKAAR